jgi:hypothetical protein
MPGAIVIENQSQSEPAIEYNTDRRLYPGKKFGGWTI